jgi:hypothetical protein
VGKMKIIDNIIDWWLTWTTGKDKVRRDWEKWSDENIVHRANTLQNYYTNFKHIIEVDPKKFWDFSEPFAWCVVEDFMQYEYPQRQLGDNAVGNWFRGYWDQWDGRFHITDLAGSDRVFVATNNDEDALMIALKYS